MDTLDKEREYIKDRMAQIKADMHDIKRTPRHIVIAAGEPVLEEDEAEFRALSRMAEILEFGMRQKYADEYWDLRNQTQLEKLDPSLKFKFRDPSRPIPLGPASIAIEKYEKNEKPMNLYSQPEEGLAAQNSSMNGIENTSEYIAKVVGNPATNGTVPLGSSPLAKENNTNAGQGKAAPEGNPYFAWAREHAIDVDWEPVEENVDPTKNTFASTEGSPQNNSTPTGEPPHSNHPDVEDPPLSLESGEEELVEVVKTSPWKWVSEHKKQILIGLGVSALVIAAVVAAVNIGPAVMAAEKATQVAGLAGEMLKNSAMWHGAAATEQVSLHAANTALANFISSMTGATATYTNSTGVWTIGSQALSQFAATASTNAAAAASKVALLTNIKNVSLIGAPLLGSVGVASSLVKKKSQEYKTIKKSISNLVHAASSMSEEDQLSTAQMISDRILSSEGLSDSERKILSKKLQTALGKIKNQNRLKEEQQEQDMGFDPANYTDEELNDIFFGSEPEPEPIKAM